MIDRNEVTALNLDSVEAIVDFANKAMKVFLEKATQVTLEQLGLDPRSHYGQNPWIADGPYGRCLVFLNPTGSLDYYGGFEYVEKGCVTKLGDYVLYSEEDSRIAEHIATALGEECDEVEED